MNQHVHLRLGTRSSPLAMAQATETRTRLCAAHGWSEDAVELVSVLASGDKVQGRSLAEIGGKALWTKELDQWLHERRIDAAVHSMKDVETIRPDWLTIAAILPRADVRDVLVGADGLGDLPHGARVGTSSPRRAAQVLHCRPDCRIVPMRGNVATRLAKLEAGEADATLLAAAGLGRLGMSVGAPLDPSEWIPAAAQGAIGIECRTDDENVRALLAAIDHAPSRAQVMAERALLEGLGGTCHSPVAAICTGETELTLRAALFSPDGKDRVEGEIRFAAGDLDTAMAFAAELLGRSPSSIAAHFNGA
jgi:hydroxymethylbilane synthase